MNRRKAIRNTSFMIGGLFSASAVAAIFDSCVAPAEGDVWKPDNMTVEEGKLVSSIVDILIPSTDTPGALDALVPQFIDRYFGIMLKEEEKKFFTDGTTQFLEAFKAANGKPFLKASADEQLAFLKEEDKKFVQGDGMTWFGALKEITYRAFFSSEEGATEVLKYDPVPGNYDGCIPYSEVNGTWAT